MRITRRYLQALDEGTRRYEKASQKQSKHFGRHLQQGIKDGYREGKLSKTREAELDRRRARARSASNKADYYSLQHEGEVINAVGAIQRNRNIKPRQRHQWSHVTVGPFPDHFKKAPVKKRTTLNTKKKDVSEGEVVKGNFQRGKNQKKRLFHGSVVAGPGYKKPDPKNPSDKKPDWAGLGRAFGRSRPKSEETELAEMKGKGKLEKIRDHHEDQEGKIMRHGERGSFSPPKHKQALANYHSAQKDRAHDLMDKRDAKKTKKEETELDEKMITRRIMGRTSSGKKKTKAPFTSNVSGSGAPDPVLRHKSNTRAKMRAKGENPHKDESMDLIALTKKLLDAKTGELRKDVEVVKAEMAKIAEEKPVEKHK